MDKIDEAQRYCDGFCDGLIFAFAQPKSEALIKTRDEYLRNLAIRQSAPARGSEEKS